MENGKTIQFEDDGREERIVEIVRVSRRGVRLQVREIETLFIDDISGEVQESYREAVA